MTTFVQHDPSEAVAIAQAVARNADLQRRGDALARDHGWRDLDEFTTWQRNENTRKYSEEIEKQTRDRGDLADLVDRRNRPWAYDKPRPTERPFGNLTTFDGRTLRSVDSHGEVTEVLCTSGDALGRITSVGGESL